MIPLHELKLTACCKLDTPGPGFALPLFERNSQSGHWFYQKVSNLDDRVVSFQPIDIGSVEIKYVLKLITPTDNHHLFCFVDENGNVSGGALHEIEPTLRSFAKRNPTETAVLLQIGALIGDASAIRRSDERFIDSLLKSTNSVTLVTSMARSLLRQRLWDFLLHVAVDNDGVQWVLANRTRLEFTVRADGIMLIGVGDSGIHPSIRLPDQLKVEDVLKHSALNQFLITENARAQRGKPLNRLLTRFRDLLEECQLPHERIVIVLRLLMLDREAGLVLMEEISQSGRGSLIERVSAREFRRASLMFGTAEPNPTEWHRLFMVLGQQLPVAEFKNLTETVQREMSEYDVVCAAALEAIRHYTRRKRRSSRRPGRHAESAEPAD